MLPYFHAAGHFLYVKSAHLYVQDMKKLEFSMENVAVTKFTNNFLSIKRTNKYFSGTRSVFQRNIEQLLVKSSKSNEGSQVGEVLRIVLSKWIFGLLRLRAIFQKS